MLAVPPGMIAIPVFGPEDVLREPIFLHNGPEGLCTFPPCVFLGVSVGALHVAVELGLELHFLEEAVEDVKVTAGRMGAFQ